MKAASSLLLWLALAVSCCAQERFASVYISELLAAGRKNDTERNSGWIELHNGGSEVVHLSGWSLSDTKTNLARWRFPRVSILPGSYLVVSTGRKGGTNDPANLQASFTLDSNGGYVALAEPGTNIVFELSYPKLSAGVAFGSVRGEPSLRGQLHEPTRGKPNQSNGEGFAPNVSFSRTSASLSAPIVVELSCVSTSAVIHYTLDGRLPNGKSPIYGAPLTVTTTTCVRARAYESGLLPGLPRGETYTFLATNVMSFNSTLPVIVMDMRGREELTSQRSLAVQLSFYEPVDGKTTLTNQPTLTTRAGFHRRGSSSAGMPQPSFAVEFLDEFDDERSLPALGLPANSDWVLYAPNVYDPGMIHNPFIHDLSHQMGRYSPRTRFVEVFLVFRAGPVSTRNYFGVYVLEEKIKIGKQRVAIDRLSASDLKPPEVTGGYLLKFDRLGPEENGFVAGGAEMVYVDPKESVMQSPQRAPQRRYISQYFDEFERALNGPGWKDPDKGYRAYIDVDSWIDFHVLEVLSGNVDIFHFSTFFYKPRGGKITFGPHWDFDRALGSIDHRDADPRRWNTGRFFQAPWWARLFSDPDFWQLWVDRWQGLRQTNFSETNLFALVDRLANEVREAQPREAKRWGLEPRGDSYQSEIDWMKFWLSERMAFIDEQLVQPPRFEKAGGKVAPGFTLKLTASDSSAIYYTLDGSDPRAPQGGISTNAVVYSGPIELTANARIAARARDARKRQVGGRTISTPMSSAVTASFTIEAP